MENILFFFANLPVYSYGAMLGLGLVLGALLAQREGKRKGIGSDFVFSFVLRAALAFIAVGRFSCVFRIYGWRTILFPWTLLSGPQLDEKMGLVAAGVYSIYFIIRHVGDPASFLDALTPSIALMQSLAYLGSTVLGRETTSSWGVDLGEFVLHPLPLYSALAFYVIFSFLWKMRRNLRYDGQLFLGYLTLSALAQHILLRFREVFGESTHPWLYLFSFVLFGATWIYLYLQSPSTDSRRRFNLNDWRAWLMYLASVLGVGLIMVKFFFWRFS